MSKPQLSLALLSGGGILLEIALTRLFSTLFFPPYVFAIISVAVLGIGLGAALATARPAWRRPSRSRLYLTAAGYSTLILLLTVVWTAAVDWRGALLVLVLLPYLFIGLALATKYTALILLPPLVIGGISRIGLDREGQPLVLYCACTPGNRYAVPGPTVNVQISLENTVFHKNRFLRLVSLVIHI